MIARIIFSFETMLAELNGPSTHTHSQANVIFLSLGVRQDGIKLKKRNDKVMPYNDK
jgi:hypothetical protein